ncbi:hypothetical protein K7432_007444 [Basidiobolus ranarum]|uniref:Questin oxidase family protein n=1 Tax=Basidiobolus ranarum TaxID=34480 RepID=A0ABR2W117_9FUNG
MNSIVSIQVLEELISRNHRDYHIYFDGLAHNHTPHLLCSLYNLGASEKRMRSTYEKATRYLEPLPQPKHTVNEGNYSQCIGVRDTYRDLLDFFDEQIAQTGFDKIFAKYAPPLLPGLVGEAAHPLIHLGYAVEFRQDLLLSEALALCTIGYDPHGELINEEFSEPAYKDPITIIEEMSRDSRFQEFEYDPYTDDSRDIDIPHSEYTKEYYKAWDSSIKHEGLDEKMRELSHGIAFLFLGHKPELRLDFLLCHAMTGLHAGRMLLPILSESDQVRILRLVWFTALTLFVSVGRPLPKWENLIHHPAKLLLENNEFWEEIDEAAIQDGDIFAHAIKSVRAMKELAKAYPQDEELWRHGAKKVLDLVDDHYDWGRRLGLEPAM